MSFKISSPSRVKINRQSNHVVDDPLEGKILSSPFKWLKSRMNSNKLSVKINGKPNPPVTTPPIRSQFKHLNSTDIVNTHKKHAGALKLVHIK
jgi:hypothetical protein